jgi:hypothetical protein
MSTYLIDNESGSVHEVDTERDGSRIPCPFHDGTDDNCHVGPDKGFHCYVCNAQGLALTPDEYKEWKERKNRESSGNKGDPVRSRSCVAKVSDEAVKTMESVAPSKAPEPKILWNDVVREHIYYDLEGKPVYKKTYYKLENGDKKPIQYRHEQGQWKTGLTDDSGKKVTLIPYNLKNIVNESKVVYTEGEKDVDTLMALGITNVTTLGSANSSMEKHQWKYFRNKTIIIIPDNDKAGYESARKIGKQLCPIATSVHICFLPGLKDGDKADISDWFDKVNPVACQALSRLTDKGVAKIALWTKLLECSKSFVAAKQLWKYEETSGDNISFTELVRAYEYFPMSVFPPDLQDYIKGMTESLDCPIDWVACSLLAMSAGLIGNAVVLRTGYRNWTEKPNLALILIARSGTGKSHPLSKTLTELTELDKNEKRKYDYEKRRYDLRTKEKDKENLPEKSIALEKPVRKRFLIHDITMEQVARALAENPRGLMWYSDEFAELFKGLNQYKGHGNDGERLIKLLDGRTFEVTRSDHELYVYRPSISLFGTIQNKVVATLLTQTTKDNGFAYRFLYCNAPYRYSVVKEDAAEEIIGNLNSLIYSLIQIPVSYDDDGDDYFMNMAPEDRAIQQETKPRTIRPIVLNFTEEARQQSVYYHNNYFRELKIAFGYDDLIAGIISKVETYFVKFCLILHCIQHGKTVSENLEIEVSTVNKAFRLAQYFLHHNYQTLSSGQQGRDSYDQIKRWSDRKGKKVFTPREIQQGIRAIGDAQRAREALLEIEGLGKGHFIDSGKKFKLTD